MFLIELIDSLSYKDTNYLYIIDVIHQQPVMVSIEIYYMTYII
jgi:hypothetical protein